MKKTNHLILFFLLGIAGIYSTNAAAQGNYKYTIPDKALYDTIVKLDSIFFDTYNHCSSSLDKYAAFYAEDLEFYHDTGGLDTSKASVVAGTKKHICGKVTRELVKGSIEVYPIKDYGAIEMGLHIFHNNQEKQTGPPEVGRFTIFWRKTAEGWKIAKVISLH